jgi:hypothetical protein
MYKKTEGTVSGPPPSLLPPHHLSSYYHLLLLENYEFEAKKQRFRAIIVFSGVFN